MGSPGRTIWEMLEDCVGQMSGDFRASEMIGWFRRHHPEVNEPSIRAHIQGATSNASAASRGAFAHRPPLLTRVDHGLYQRYQGESAAAPRKSALLERAVPATSHRHWYSEADVQSAVVSHLVRDGWKITSVADTATRARGVDVVASRGDDVIGVEVKGYPGREYADAGRAGEIKRTSPSAQAAVYFAQAVVSAMRLRSRQPHLLSVIALPDLPRYEALSEDVRGSLIACRIEVWLVAEDGSVTRRVALDPTPKP